MRLLPLVLCSFFSLAASANILGIHTVDLDNNPLPSAQDPSFNQTITQAFADTDLMFPATTDVNLFVVSVAGNNAGFDGGSVITIPRRMEFTNGYGSEDMQTYAIPQMNMITVAIHEYGHAIFDKRLVREFPIAAQESVIRREMSALLIEIARGVTPARRAAINAEYDLRAQLIQSNREMGRFAVVAAAYNELFADVVAVYNLDAKSAMYTALYYDGLSDHAAAMLAGRSFEAQNTVQNWRYDESHVLLAPLRTVIGSERCWPRNLAEKRTKIAQLETILINGIREKLRGNADMTVADNTPLIEAFQRTCR